MDRSSDSHSIAIRLASEWGVELGERLTGSTCSNVYRCADGFVLKVPHEGSEERGAAWASIAYSANGGIRVSKADDATGSLLMEEAGAQLHEAGLSEEQQLRVAADLIKQLHSTPADARAQNVANWFSEEPINAGSLTLEAWRIAQHLIASTRSEVLLHGDLHHGNILLSKEGWRAIDPKGLRGDPAFDISGYIRNPVGQLPSGPELETLTRRRLKFFADNLPYPAERLWGWSFAQTAWCALSGSTEDWVEITELLWDLKNEFSKPT